MRGLAVLTCVAGFLLFSQTVFAQGTGDHLEEFIRADANGDGQVTVSDASFITNYLFHGGPPPNCLDAADANDDGLITGADASYITSYLFQGGSAPPAPFPDCGEDPTEDYLDCESYSSCP